MANEEQNTFAYHLPVGKNGRMVTIPCDTKRSVAAMQKYVGGLFELLDIDPEFDIWVNEEGLINGSQPNRAIFATDYISDNGYLNQFDFKSVPKPGELYSIVFGDILVTGKPDPDGNMLSLTSDQVAEIENRFGNPGTGTITLIAIKSGLKPSQITAEKTAQLLGDLNRNLNSRAAGAKEAADALASGKQNDIKRYDRNER